MAAQSRRPRRSSDRRLDRPPATAIPSQDLDRPKDLFLSGQRIVEGCQAFVTLGTTRNMRRRSPCPQLQRFRDGPAHWYLAIMENPSHGAGRVCPWHSEDHAGGKPELAARRIGRSEVNRSYP